MSGQSLRDSMCDSGTFAEQHRAARRDELVRDALASSVVSDLATLRLALAEIVADGDGRRVYACDGCGEAGTGCGGHVPSDIKIARAALGLPPLPDREWVTLPPGVKAKRRNAAAEQAKAKKCAAGE